VIIQTWQPKHPVIRDVIQNDYLSMFYREMAERKKFKYPPYYKLIRIVIKHKKIELLKEGSDALGQELKVVFKNMVYGPEFPVVSRIRGYYLNHIILKILQQKTNNHLKTLLLKR
jgi:primosomal protein N' (replication factor Y)